MVRAGYKQTEIGVLPETWEVKQLHVVANIERGKFTARPRNDPKYYGGEVPFIQTGDVANSQGKVTTYSQTLNEEGLRVSKLFQQGTIFFTIAANIGDIGVCTFDAACPDSLVAISPRGKINRAWLAHELSSLKSSFERLATHNAQLNINLEKLRPYLLPVPPTSAEQEAIAGALSDADALIESLEQLLTKKRQIKQGAMQELLTGKRRLPGFNKTTKKVFLGEVATFHKGKLLQKSDIDPAADTPCIHYGELFTTYQEVIKKVVSRTKMTVDAILSLANDVLMPTSDVTPRGLAKASCIQEAGVILGGDILVIRPDQKCILGEFLSYAIRHNEKEILTLVTGSTVFHLYASDMKKFSFWLPEASEQRAIIGMLEELSLEITTLGPVDKQLDLYAVLGVIV